MLPETYVIRDSVATAPVNAPPVDAAQLEREAFGDTLLCPRCGYILRGLTADRCPECGLTVDWNAIIAAARRRVEVPTFEYQWRERPVASFFSTLWLSIQPWKIWKRIPLTAEPRPKALLLFVALMPVIYFVAMLFFTALNELAIWFYFEFFGHRFHPFMQLFHSPSDFTYFMQFQATRFSILLGLGTFVHVTLRIFQKSLLGYRVRRAHLLRISVMVFAGLIGIQVARDLIKNILMSLTWFPIPYLDLAWRICLVPFDLVFLIVPTWSIIRAARDYLQVRRPWQFGLTILFLGYLLTVTTHLAYCVIVDDISNSLSYAGGDLWPGLDWAGQWIWWWLGLY